MFLTQSIRFLRRDLSKLKNIFSVEEVITSFMTPKFFLSMPMTFLLEDFISELYVSWNVNCAYTVSIEERVMLCLNRRAVNIGNSAGGGNIFFSTVVSVSPFLGLFGTVWSIIKYFVNFSYTQCINFSLMSSGVAESLVLTGLGLFVAIPAVIMHSVFLRSIIIYENIIDDCVAHCILLLKRDTDSSLRVSQDVLFNAYQNYVLVRKGSKI